MAVRTTSIVPYKITNIPDRYTMVYVCDDTVVATTVGTGAVKRLNRLQGGSFRMATNVMEITEMGSQFRPGGIDDLGEVQWNLSWAAVGLTNLASLLSVPLPTTAGATTTIGASNINAATIDIIRMVADANGNVFGTLYMQDCIMLDYGVDARDKQFVTESATGSGPDATFFPGYIIPKVYVLSGTDATNGYANIATILGSNEAIVPIYEPNSGQVPSYWSQNGTVNFLKIERVPLGNLANSPIRYSEYVYTTGQSPIAISSTAYFTPAAFLPQITQVGQNIQLGIGTANVETVAVTAIASIVNTNSNASTAIVGSSTITPVSMLGIFPGVTLQVVNANGTNAETIQVTSTVPNTSFTATFASTKTAGFLITTKGPSYQANVTKTHVAADPINAALTNTQGTQGTAMYNPATNRLYFGDQANLAATDVVRLTIMSYNTNSFPTAIPVNSPDTTDRAAVSSRLASLTIAGLGVNRVQSAAFRLTLRREHENGVGENTIIYGISGVPDVAVTLDVKETDLTLLSQLRLGTKNLTAQGGTINNDFQPLNQLTREELATAIPAQIILRDPFNAANILCVWNCPQVVIRDIDYTSSAKADNAVRITAMDITGNMTVSQTNPA